MKVLVSACLVGEMVRYDGKVNINEELIKRLNENNIEIIPFCPEVESGLSVPRNPSEIKNGDGEAVLKRESKVINNKGEDVTDYILKGANLALERALSLDIKAALLKDGCASCGSSYVFDGNFNGTRVEGKGIATLFLERNNIKVFNENQIQMLLESKL